MTMLPDRISQLHDALVACLAMPHLPTGLRESMNNLQRALLKKYAPPDDAAASEAVLLACENAPLSQQAQQRIEEKIEVLLKEIQYATEDGKDTLSLEADLRALTDYDPVWEQRLAEARRKGENAARERKNLDNLLHQDLCSVVMKQYWQELPQRAGWFRKKAARQIRWVAGKQLQHHLARDGFSAASQWLADARKIFGDVLEDLECTQPVEQVVIPRATDHRLTYMQPAQRWFVYIDESGQSFSTDENGSEGYIVAVCTRDGEPLPPLKLHCTEASPSRVLKSLSDLLRQPCGIFGLSQSALNIRSREGWLQSVRELVKWVWRLLPLPDNGLPSQLSIYIEQRGQYTAETVTDFGEKMLQAELIREDPERAEKIRIQQLEFADKSNPHCAWADVVSYCWQSRQPDIKKAVRESGLLDSCLVRLDASVLSLCHDVMIGQNPDAAGWQQLVTASLRPGLLVSHALNVLQQRCREDASLWEPYARAMQDYLLGKEYELAVLEGMAQWLSPMRTDDPATRFFWLSARLAHLNHKGDAASDELNEVKSHLAVLAPQMGTLDPVAELHVALRLAVSDANAFSFARAEARLASWNPDERGQLTGTALWDGKILSSLGQYRAFQRDLAGACRFFRQALEQFAQLPADEARRQSAQTQTYLAIASMDRPHVDNDAVRRLVEAALGQEIPAFIKSMAGEDGLKNRYGHYLLTRYLSCRGTEEERGLYLGTRSRWTCRNEGFAAGHPWPIIQYHRWLMTDRDDTDLRKALAESLLVALGEAGMLTVELITWAIALSMGTLRLGMNGVSRRLYELAVILPDCDSLVRQLLAAENPDERLAQRLLPFNYC